MYLFKTSGSTFDSVISNQKHAFKGKPRDWHKGELVLVSKNKADCAPGEKQISYIMRLNEIRRTSDGEIENYWPGNPGRWNYIVDCIKTEQISMPFNLKEILGYEAKEYNAVMTFKKVREDHKDMINNFLFSSPSNDPDVIPPTQPYVEGAVQSIIVNAYERNPKARAACLDYYGFLCQACGFNFEEKYGKLGKGFIHVHHVVPLAEIGQQYEVDPLRDLVPLCANCHAMIHREIPALTLSELKLIILGELE